MSSSSMKIIKLIKNPLGAAIIALGPDKFSFLPDKYYLKIMFRYCNGSKLNIDNPTTYNEKLQWIKLYDRKPAYKRMVDKYEVKKYVSELIGNQYIIPTIGVWDKFDEIDFTSLPDQFVLKCTHDSGGLVICRDKSSLNLEQAKRKIEKSLHTDYFCFGREWPYKGIKPRIIAERYMEDESGCELKDYKVLCFNGEPKLIELHRGRFTNHQSQDFYDIKWNKLSISQSGLDNYQTTDDVFPKPATLDEMISLSRVLSEGIPHIRVDWYSVKDKLYFGELTFFDGSGFDPWDNPDDDLMLGSWINLPEKTVEREG